MLAPPVSKPKEPSHPPRTAKAPEQKRILHPPFSDYDPSRANSAPTGGVRTGISQPEASQPRPNNNGIQHFFLQIPTTSPASLTINEPGDRYEQEADQVADQVMRMSLPAAIAPQTSPRSAQEAPTWLLPQATRLSAADSAPGLQQKCAGGGT